MTVGNRRQPSPQREYDPPLITGIRRGSPCAFKVRRKDLLLEINGKQPRDILDYLQAAEGELVSLRLRRGDREITRRIRKRSGVPLGLLLDRVVFDGVRTCVNHCPFCFVDQLSPGMRPALYLKDDDYRLSFYYGNFITLNNIYDEDLERILKLRLSPLYVSLHSTDPQLRSRLMGGEARRGLEALSLLLREGIEIHLQVVVCPDLNDGEALRRTFRDVLESYTARSLGAVPLGLTSRAPLLSHRLVAHSRASARQTLETVREFQELAKERYGRRLFFAADEFFLLAGEDFPPAEEYEGYPQLDNGVGMARKFLDGCGRAAGETKLRPRPGLGVITGVAGAPVISRALREACWDNVELLVVENRVFGAPVTATSLLGGGDIAAALSRDSPASRRLLFPATLLNEGRFIDDLTPGDVERKTGYTLMPVEVDGEAFVRSLTARAGRR